MAVSMMMGLEFEEYEGFVYDGNENGGRGRGGLVMRR